MAAEPQRAKRALEMAREADAAPPQAGAALGGSERKAAASQLAAAPAAPRAAALREDPACPGERTRTLRRAPNGRLVARERTGVVGGIAYHAVERYDLDGMLTDATLRLGGRELRLRSGALGPDGLEPYPGLRLAATAAEAEAAPPACGP